jgi:hypothetical protein
VVEVGIHTEEVEVRPACSQEECVDHPGDHLRLPLVAVADGVAAVVVAGDVADADLEDPRVPRGMVVADEVPLLEEERSLRFPLLGLTPAGAKILLPLCSLS